LAEVPFFSAARAACEEQALHIVEQEHGPACRVLLVPVAVELALARVLEELPKLLFAVSVTSAGDISAVHDHQHDVVAGQLGRERIVAVDVGLLVHVMVADAVRVLVAMRFGYLGDLAGEQVSAENPCQLIREAAPHGRLADADAAVEEKSFERAARDVIPPLVSDDRRRLRQHASVWGADDVVRANGGSIGAGLAEERTELLEQPGRPIEIDVRVSHCPSVPPQASTECRSQSDGSLPSRRAGSSYM